MNFLLDTHCFIWLISEPSKIDPKILSVCKNPENILYLSVVSIWEMQIKTRLGRLKLTLPLTEFVDRSMAESDIRVLDLKKHHIWKLQELPALHKDPFDRMLISQAVSDDLTLITQDAQVKQYPVKTL